MSDRIEILKTTDLEPFPNHPFQVREDDAMRETVESVKEYGILTPMDNHIFTKSSLRRRKVFSARG